MGILLQLFANRRFYAIMVAAVTLGRFIAVNGFYNTSKCSLSRQISVDTSVRSQKASMTGSQGKNSQSEGRAN